MKYILIFFVLLTFTLNAQDSIKPKFEKEGELTKAVFYHDNAEIAQTGYFKRKGHGNWISYHPSGKKSAMGTYKSGLKTGQMVFFERKRFDWRDLQGK